MKKNALSLLVALAVIAPATQAAVQLPEGTQEISVQGNLNFQDDYQLNLATSYGYFVMDNWEVGAVLDANISDEQKLAKLGAFTEYNFVNTTNWVPYVGAAAQLAGFSYVDTAHGHDGSASFGDEEKDGAAINFKLSAGVKYFINPNVALTAEVNYNIATDDLDVNGDGFANILFGTRFYF
jgi:outer membrane protein W